MNTRFSTTAYDRVLATLTVADICTPFVLTVVDESPAEVLRLLSRDPYPGECSVLAVKGDWLYYLDPLEISAFHAQNSDADLESRCPDELLHELAYYRAVSADTPLLDVFPLLANPRESESAQWLVLQGTNWIGRLGRNHLRHPLCELAMLGLCLALERDAAQLCALHGEACFALLPPERQTSAWQRWIGHATPEMRNHVFGDILADLAKKLPAEGDWKQFGELLRNQAWYWRALIDCTMFCDKGTMLRKGRVLLRASATKVGDSFGTAETLRNECAHPSRMRDPKELAKLLADVAEVKELYREVRESLDREIGGRLTPTRSRGR